MTPGVYVREKDISSRRTIIGSLGRSITISGPGGGGGPLPEAFSYYLYGSGDNSYYQLLEPYQGIKFIPTEISTIQNVIQIEAGFDSTFALKSDNTLWGWRTGSSEYDDYNLFNGIVSSSTTPVQLSGSWSQISIGYDTIFGIKTDGTLWGWGYNSDGELLVSGPQTEPVQIGSDNDWIYIKAGGNRNVLGIRSSGSNTLWGWGPNTGGELGTGNTTAVTTITQIPGTGNGWSEIDIFGDFGGASIALKNDGTLWSAGTGYSGQLGQGESTTTLYTFTQIGSDTDWAKLGGRHTAIKSNGTLWQWGPTSLNTVTFADYVPTNYFSEYGPWASGSGDPNAIMHAIKTDGTLWTWGDASSDTGAAFGYGGVQDTKVPIQVGTSSNWVKTYYTVYNTTTTYGVNSSGTLYGWGQSKGLYYSDANFDAEDLLGFELTGSVSRVNAFMQIDTNQWVSGSAYPEGRSFLLMKSDGTLWGLGDNSYGQLGVGNRIISEGARQVGSATWKQVSIGLYSAGGITTDDKLYTWGGNLYAQLGTGSLSDIVTTPVWIEQDSTWNSFSLGHNHALAVKSNGTLWTWGSASNGVMGLGVDDSFSVTPTQIGSDSDWSAVFASRYASFAIKTDGSLYGWGYNYYNQLGFGDADTIYNTPNLVDSGPWKLIISDTDHTYGLKTDSTLWGWGENDRKIIPDPNAVFSDEGDSGVYKNYSVVTGGDFVAEPFTSVRLLVDTGSCTTSSLSNSLLGSGSLTLDDTATGGNDDGSWQLSLPFNVVYCGISYSTIYVSTNSVIWFGSEYSDDYLSISEKDGYGYRIYYGQEGNTFRIRFEGDSRYQQDGGPKIWEVVFYQNTPNQIDIHVGENTSWKLTATNEPQLTPALVASGSWKSISTSQGSGQALYGVKSDGTLWMAGENSRGELGFGDNTEVQNWSNDRRITFVQLGSDTDWESVIGAKYTTWALKSS